MGIVKKLLSFNNKEKRNADEVNEQELAQAPKSDIQNSLPENNVPQIEVEEEKNHSQINQEVEKLEKENEVSAANSTLIQLTNAVEEFKKLSRQHYLNTAAVQESSTIMKELNYSLQDSKYEFNETKKYLDELLVHQRQENGELKREIKNWQRSCIEFFQLMERALDYEKEENKALIERILNEYARIVSVRGLDRIIPQPGEPIVENFHHAVTEEASEIEPGNISKCNSWGYRIGTDVIERAKVVTSKAPVQESQQETSHSSEENVVVTVSSPDN